MCNGCENKNISGGEEGKGKCALWAGANVRLKLQQSGKGGYEKKAKLISKVTWKIER